MGDQPDLAAPLVVRARTCHVPFPGSKRAEPVVADFRNDVHVDVPLRRTWTSYARFLGLSPASHRSFQPSSTEPVAVTGTLTRPTIIEWIEQ